jgi:nucleoid-associated protein YgaU
MTQSGTLTKLKIDAYKGPKYLAEDRIKEKDSTGKSTDKYLKFVAMFNPTAFNRKLAIEYGDKQGFGSDGASSTFVNIKPQEYSIELFVDGTGTSGPKVSVPDQIKKFLSVCAEYNGKQHRPNYLLISWAELVLKALLTNVDISYTLFDNEGVPLRAKIAATFLGTIDDDLRTKQQRDSSPDLTHVRVVVEGDTLPLMTKQIYGNSKYYMQVAEANQLKNFRNLKPGTTLFFPPIVK